MGTAVFRVGLVGWNGRRNVGDDAMTSVLVHQTANRVGNPLRVRILADRSALPDLSRALPRDRVEGFAGYNRILGVPKATVRNRLRRILYDRRFAANLDLLVFGGGSILHSCQGIRRYSDLLARAKESRPDCRVGGLGVSLGPFASAADRHMCAALIRRFDFIGVRDRFSWDELSGMGVDVPSVRGVDLAVLFGDYADVHGMHATDSSIRLGVALRHGVLSMEDIDALGFQLRRLLARQPGFEISLFVFCADARTGDEQATWRLANAIGHPGRVRVHPYSADPAVTYQMISKCTLMLAMRLHAAVLAYAVQTPLVMLSYHAKCSAFAEEIGLNPDLHFNGRVFDPRQVVAQVEAVLASTRSQAAQLPLEIAKESARSHLELLDCAVFKRTGSGPADARHLNG